MKLNTIPLRHRICARPALICWVIGSLGLWGIVTLLCAGLFSELLGDVTGVIFLFFAYIGLGGIGYYVGIFSAGGYVLSYCRKVNGAPFAVGDTVMILTGPFAGRVTKVREVTVGQWGVLLPCLDLGEEIAAKYGDLFDDWTLWRQPENG